MPRPDLSPRLLLAWRRTGYAAGGAVAWIGRRCPEFDRLLETTGLKRGGFVGAANPGGRRYPPGWNRRAAARLAAAIRCLPSIPGEGFRGRWREPHLLIGADARRLAVIARRFRQRGLVLVARGAPARLKLLILPQTAGRT